MLRLSGRSRAGSAVFVAAATLAIAGASGAGAQSFTLTPPTPAQMEKALAALSPDVASPLMTVRGEVSPTFVFIPGVLGSEIIKKLPDGTTRTIWGQLGNLTGPPDIETAYSAQDEVSVKVLNDYYAFGKAFDVYGKAIRRLKIMLGAKGVETFAYDWRQSNARSSRDLSKWLCDRRERLAQGPVIFIAHSMGGLVLTHWLKNRHAQEQCGAEKFSAWLRVKKVILLGTPYYGAPKAVYAFADQYNLLVEPGTLAAKFFGRWDAKTFSKALNAFGPTFPSAYELLPIVNTSSCFKKPDWPRPVELRVGGLRKEIDLFDAPTWEMLGWPVNLDARFDRATFMKDRLPSLLKSAKEFLCDVANYDPAGTFNVTRIYGHKNKTICRIAVVPSERPGEKAKLEPTWCDVTGEGAASEEAGQAGDGTVPLWIAADRKRLREDVPRGAAARHMDLPNSDGFMEYLELYDALLHQEFQTRAADRMKSIDGVVALYSKLAYFVPATPQTSFAGLTTQMTTMSAITSFLAAAPTVSAQVNKRVAQELKISAESLYAMAKAAADPAERAKAFLAYASVADTVDKKRAWALNNAAHIYLGSGDFTLARRLAVQAYAIADKDKSGVLTALKGRASLTAGIASVELNNADVAKAFRDLAVSNGNTKALNAAVFSKF